MQDEKPLKILILASEVVPFAKVGGLADVVGALPKALQELGHDVRLAMPRYGQINPQRFELMTALDTLTVNMASFQEQISVLKGTIGKGIPVYMIDAPRYFDRENIYGYIDDGERFILFCRAALEAMRAFNWSPDIIHCNDWQTGIVPNWMHTVYRDDPFFASTATVHTIHTLAYQQDLAPRRSERLRSDRAARTAVAGRGHPVGRPGYWRPALSRTVPEPCRPLPRASRHFSHVQ